jgi:FtsP/CotA-like multicopper oxidase with cupredoxin domain
VSVWTSGPYRVLAVDGTDVHEPGQVEDEAVRLTAGGRADLEVVAPARVDLGGATALVVGDGADRAEQPREALDLLSYGRPRPLGFDPEEADRRFEYRVGRRPGFLDGRPGLWWSINGKLFPDVPMYTVTEGDVVRMRLENSSGVSHPMHLHGHHAVVLSRNGERATGSPWVVDSLDVADGDSYEIAFVADNPGLWMDHCHNLPHAADGLVAHLVYDGVHGSFQLGGRARNEPE